MNKILDLGLTADANEIQVFHCPSCSEEIDTTMESCPGCSALVDPNAAATEIAVTEEAGRAYTYATYLILLAVALPAVYLLGWLLELEPIGGWGYTILWVATPAAVGGWWVRYRSVKSDNNPAIATAKRRTIIPLAIWAVMLVVLEIAPVIYLTQILSPYPKKVVVIKDSNDVYWALPVSKIKKSGFFTITLERGAIAASGSGNESSAFIAEQLISRAVSGPRSPKPGYILIESGFWGGEPGKLSGKVEITSKDTEIRVRDVIKSRSLE